MFKFRNIYILDSILAILGFIATIGRAIYVIVNGLVNFEMTNDAVLNNPFELFFLAILLILAVIGLIFAYKSDKEFEDAVAKLQQKYANEKDNSGKDS